METGVSIAVVSAVVGSMKVPSRHGIVQLVDMVVLLSSTSACTEQKAWPLLCEMRPSQPVAYTSTWLSHCHSSAWLSNTVPFPSRAALWNAVPSARQGCMMEGSVPSHARLPQQSQLLVPRQRTQAYGVGNPCASTCTMGTDALVPGLWSLRCPVIQALSPLSWRLSGRTCR